MKRVAEASVLVQVQIRVRFLIFLLFSWAWEYVGFRLDSNSTLFRSMSWLHYDSNFLYVCVSQVGGILPWSPQHQLLRHQSSACTQTSQSHQQSTQWVNNTYTVPKKSVLRFNACPIFLFFFMPSLKSTLMCQLQPLSYQSHGSVHCVALCSACRFSRAAKLEWIKEDFRVITSLPTPLAEPD